MQTQLPIVEKLFQSWQGLLGADYDAYRNHVYRVINLTHHFHPQMSANSAQLLQVAAAHHDIAIWLDDTSHYVERSADYASAWLAKNPDVGTGSLDHKQRRVKGMIHSHQKLAPVAGNEHPVVEAFRKADWVDVTWTHCLTGMPGEQRRELLAAFPDSGFHKRLLLLTAGYARSNPTAPLPMLRW